MLAVTCQVTLDLPFHIAEPRRQCGVHPKGSGGLSSTPAGRTCLCIGSTTTTRASTRITGLPSPRTRQPAAHAKTRLWRMTDFPSFTRCRTTIGNGHSAPRYQLMAGPLRCDTGHVIPETWVTASRRRGSPHSRSDISRDRRKWLGLAATAARSVPASLLLNGRRGNQLSRRLECRPQLYVT